MSTEIYTKTVDFGITSVEEAVHLNPDGSYTILINSRSACNRQLESYLHALKHIKNDDFSKTDIQSIEYYAHKGELS